MTDKNIFGWHILTQEGLLRRMKKLGFETMTDRTLTDWRSKELLPPYDLKGKGRGRGKGKTTDAWQNGRRIIEQAIFVKRFLDKYRKAEAAYLPLWFLGFDVSISRVKHALVEPLENEARSLWEAANELAGEDARTDGIIEDLLGELAFEQLSSKKFGKLSRLNMPHETFEALLNLFFNPAYNLSDTEFTYGKKKMLKWQHQMPALAGELLPQLTVAEPAPAEDQTLKFIFDYAPFIQSYFSLPAMKTAMSVCSNDVLFDLDKDLEIMREGANIFLKIGKTLSDSLPPALRDVDTMDFMPMFIWFGRLAVWTDISLRVNGFGQMINCLRSEAVAKIKTVLTPELEEELKKTVPAAAREYIKLFEQLGKEILEPKPEELEAYQNFKADMGLS